MLALVATLLSLPSSPALASPTGTEVIVKAEELL